MPLKPNPNLFLVKANIKHNNKWDYSNMVYINSRIKIEIGCKEHGSFWVTPKAHLQGVGCKECSNKIKYDNMRYSKEELILAFNNVQKISFEYDLTDYKSLKSHIKFLCKEHGWQRQRADSHLMGRSCKYCAIDNKIIKDDRLWELINQVHGNTYNYINLSDNVLTIECKKHGIFKQLFKYHRTGAGCPDCAIEKSRESKVKSSKEVIAGFHSTHKKGLFDYSKMIYKRSNIKIVIKCNKCKLFFNQTPASHTNGRGCPHCLKIISKPEYEITNLIKEIGYETINNSRKIIAPKELDIFIPSLNKAIEFNGLYWHYSEKLFKPGKHANKSNLCRAKGIKLLHIREDLWLKDKEKMKEVILKFIKGDN